MKSEHYILVQRRKSVKYAEKQHFQNYITIPIEISRLLGLVPGQVMKCEAKGEGILTYTKAEKKPRNKMAYYDWVNAIKELIPWITENGKTYGQICKEANLPLRSAPALWVRQAERDIGLTRKRDPKTRRIVWTKALAALPRKLRDLTLTELAQNTVMRSQ